MRRLRDTEWLNDEVINFYLNLIKQRSDMTKKVLGSRIASFYSVADKRTGPPTRATGPNAMFSTRSSTLCCRTRGATTMLACKSGQGELICSPWIELSSLSIWATIGVSP